MEILTLSLEEFWPPSTGMVTSAQTKQPVSTSLFLAVYDYKCFVWSLTLVWDYPFSPGRNKCHVLMKRQMILVNVSE